MSASKPVHPLVVAEIRASAAVARARYEKARVALAHANPTAMSTYHRSKQLTALGEIANSWEIIADTLGSDTEEGNE